MDFLEKDLEDVIFNSDRDTLCDRGLRVDGVLKRQVRIGNYGIADLVTYEKPSYFGFGKGHWKGMITVYELKNKNINIHTLLQAVNYLKGIQSFLELRGIKKHYNYRIILIGRSIDVSSSFIYLTDLVSTIYTTSFVDDPTSFILSYYTYSYDINGILFNKQYNYNLTNKGF